MKVQILRNILAKVDGRTKPILAGTVTELEEVEAALLIALGRAVPVRDQAEERAELPAAPERTVPARKGKK